MRKIIIGMFLMICFLSSGAVATFGAAGEVSYTSRPSTTLHTEPANDSPIISVPYMTELVNLGEVTESDAGSWVKVEYDGDIYYIWMNKDTIYLTDKESSYTYETQTQIQEKVLDRALYIYNNWDTKYAHGQSDGIADSDGRYGFDCSGFVNYVLSDVMNDYVPTYRLSSNIETLYNITDIYNSGKEGQFSAKTIMEGVLDKSKLQPGDIIFFSVGNEENDRGLPYNHCGIYLGKNEFIHSTSSWDGVCIMPLNDIYVDGFICVKRYLPDEISEINEVMYTTSQKTSVYSSMNSDLEPVTVLGAEEPVTVKYTDEGTWAYVEYSDGKYGYILSKYLIKEIENISETYYVKETTLKLYTKYTTDSAYVEVIIGTQVEYAGRYSNSSYYKVIYEGKTYYVYAPKGIESRLTKDYLKLMEGITTATVTTNTKLRSTPASERDDNVLGMVYKESKLTLIAVSESGTWCYVKTADGKYGFVLSSKLVYEMPVEKGDVNEDGVVNAIDALLILKHAASMIKFTDSQLIIGDMTEDGNVNAVDALEVLKTAAGIK